MKVPEWVDLVKTNTRWELQSFDLLTFILYSPGRSWPPTTRTGSSSAPPPWPGICTSGTAPGVFLLLPPPQVSPRSVHRQEDLRHPLQQRLLSMSLGRGCRGCRQEGSPGMAPLLTYVFTIFTTITTLATTYNSRLWRDSSWLRRIPTVAAASLHRAGGIWTGLLGWVFY